jgi:membrane-associated protein
VTLAAAPIAPTAIIPWLDPELIIQSAGPWALAVVCAIIFAETALLIGFVLPGDTLLIITGIFAFTPGIGVPIWIAALAIAAAAFAGGEVGYLIGHKAGPALFERKESGLFSIENVKRTNAFFHRFGAMAVIIARFVPVVRTMTPVMAGVGHMNYKKYSLYNAIGALIWGAGLTFAGWGLVAIAPPVAQFVTDYIDIILLLAVLSAVVPVLWHYLRSRAKAKKAGKEAASQAEVEALIVDFDHDIGETAPTKRGDA